MTPEPAQVAIREPTYYSGELVLLVHEGGRHGATLFWTGYEGGSAAIELKRHWWAKTPDDVRLDHDEIRILRDALSAILDDPEVTP